ncbi:hypothetical protein FACS1894139_00580 [Planctomycetales bacterium]|nr:hypothetical protein FACS1894107_01450 [Planctomycetales bacterium]GHS99352.1 hypothetical protein FACS1894108_09170 [Planctomycetales bacterium]GHT02434.1 hypothetical protein FACS1894139_00580 [Planctomycetales bacterium]GHV23287.1 hypothetical protein AGMMS49959_15870 [Planctomycetales bacterium]
MNWTDAFADLARQKFAGLTAAEITERWAWVDNLATDAATVLEPENLRRMPPAEIYEHLRRLSFNGVPIRLTNLGRVNDAERIVEALIKLLTTPGDFAARYRAAKFPQAGLVTLTEILCAARPTRFVCRSSGFTRALAKATPLYSYAALNEMGYEEFLDLCRVLSDELVNFPDNGGVVRRRAQNYRYLWLYAVLT